MRHAKATRPAGTHARADLPAAALAEAGVLGQAATAGPPPRAARPKPLRPAVAVTPATARWLACLVRNARLRALRRPRWMAVPAGRQPGQPPRIVRQAGTALTTQQRAGNDLWPRNFRTTGGFLGNRTISSSS